MLALAGPFPVGLRSSAVAVGESVPVISVSVSVSPQCPRDLCLCYFEFQMPELIGLDLVLGAHYEIAAPVNLWVTLRNC